MTLYCKKLGQYTSADTIAIYCLQFESIFNKMEFLMTSITGHKILDKN